MDIQKIPPQEAENLLAILHAADESDERILARLTSDLYTSYAARERGELVGAAVVRWQVEESEIEYIAVAEQMRGRSYGKAIIAALLEEGRQRQVRAMLVGTADAALDNIAFYLKCGFRMDCVRRDYFSYIQPAIFENGIPLRDMLVLRYALA